MYYVKAATRSSGAAKKGSPRRAIEYITDNHDAHRVRGSEYSDAELAYIARLGAGPKTELEGGRVPLVGFGVLSGITDHEELAARFEGACQPWHDRRGTTGYKSFTFTLPKELSLFAEDHREEARKAMYAAVGMALQSAFPDRDITAVAAIHTRNEAGEIHHHAHVLVAKFARDRRSGRTYSLNSKAGGNSAARMREIKVAWKEGVDREFVQRLGLRVEQGRPYARPTLVLADGTRIPPLHRESRRLLDRHLSPAYTETSLGGFAVRKLFRISDAMDGRIFEAASRDGGAGWNADAFLAIAPDQARYLSRYEKRVETLKRVGYLTGDGKITAAFRLHFCVRNGIDTPELQRIRVDLAAKSAKESAQKGQPVPVPSLWEAVGRYDAIRERAERVGFNREALRRIEDEAKKRKPTMVDLYQLRVRVQERVLAAHGKTQLPPPQTKTIISAFVDVQKARVRTVFMISAGLLTFNYQEKKRLANALERKARAELFYAKERRLAQVSRRFRPIFWATRIVLPRETRRIELAIGRCAGLAATQSLYREWYMRSLVQPRQQLQIQAQKLVLPEQAAIREKVDRARKVITLRDPEAALRVFARGRAVLDYLQPEAAKHLKRWQGKELELIRRVAAAAKGDADQLPRDDYRAAVQAGRIGHLLEREAAVPRVEVPDSFGTLARDVQRASARLQALGVADPFSKDVLTSAPMSQIERAVRDLRGAGLMNDGPGWTLKAQAAREVVTRIVPQLNDGIRRQGGLGS